MIPMTVFVVGQLGSWKMNTDCNKVSSQDNSTITECSQLSNKNFFAIMMVMPTSFCLIIILINLKQFCMISAGLTRWISADKDVLGWGGGGMGGAERGQGWFILFYTCNRNWHTFDTMDNRGNSFQFQKAKTFLAVT